MSWLATSTQPACCQQLPQAAQDLHLEAQLLADGDEPVEQAASGWPGGLDDIAAFEQFDPAAGPRHAQPFLDNAGPGLGGNGGYQQPLMGGAELTVGEGQPLQDTGADEEAGGWECDESVTPGRTETGSQPAASAQLPSAEASRLTTTA